MALDFFQKKAYFIGTWKDNAVTDDIIKQIATLTAVEKGRKVKLKLDPKGLKITKSSFFQGKTIFDFIHLEDIFFITINQRHPMCLLCIIRDPVHKYTIVAFRCTSELVAGTFVQHFKSLKRSAGQRGNIELSKKEDGNWTLRERTNANARRELHQLFSGTTTSTDESNSSQIPQTNGGIFYKKTEKRNTVENKPNLYEQTPYIPSHTPTIHTEVYTDTSTNHGHTIHNVGTQAIVLDDDQMSQFSDMSSIKGEMEALSAELKEVKYMLEKSTGISAQEHYRLAGITRESFNNNNENQAINYNRHIEPVVETDYTDFPDSNQTFAVARAEVPDYRSFGVQTAPKAKQRSTGPEHLIAKSTRTSTDVPSGVNEHSVRSDIDKNQYKIYSGTSVKGASVEMRHSRREPEYKVARHSGGLEPEDGVVYAAQREADVGTLAYPQSNIQPSRGSMTSTIISGNPQRFRSRKTKSLNKKMTPSYGIPSVVECPIEDIYSRPVIIRRDYIVGSVNRRRPHSMYVSRSAENGSYVYGSQNMSAKKF